MCTPWAAGSPPPGPWGHRLDVPPQTEQSGGAAGSAGGGGGGGLGALAGRWPHPASDWPLRGGIQEPRGAGGEGLAQELLRGSAPLREGEGCARVWVCVWWGGRGGVVTSHTHSVTTEHLFFFDGIGLNYPLFLHLFILFYIWLCK